MSIYGLLDRLSTMGCVCGKESVKIDGHTFYVKERIGEGGFSNIDLVENARTKKKYALKRIICHSIEDQNQANKEIEYHKMFDHPNILPLVNSDVKGRADIVHNLTSQVFLLLPYFPKGTLSDELSRREMHKNHFGESVALVLFLQICEGVQHMHQQNSDCGGPYAHRDLKPHNVLLREDLKPVIMDLGSVEPARLRVTTHSEAQHLQDLAAERCSMPYRPPELFQVDSKCDIDERTDVWSLGCLLHAIAFFKSPFDLVLERGDSVALAVQSGSDNVKFPANSPYSNGLHELIKWMLTAELSSRPHLSEVIDKAGVLAEAAEERL